MICLNCGGELKMIFFKRKTTPYTNNKKEYAKLECKECGHMEVFG